MSQKFLTFISSVWYWTIIELRYHLNLQKLSKLSQLLHTYHLPSLIRSPSLHDFIIFIVARVSLLSPFFGFHCGFFSRLSIEFFLGCWACAEKEMGIKVQEKQDSNNNVEKRYYIAKSIIHLWIHITKLSFTTFASWV